MNRREHRPKLGDVAATLRGLEGTPISAAMRREILAAHPEYAQRFVPLPFNSGYFMCVRPLHVDAEALRKKLLADYSTGTINFGGVLRIAFSATPTGKLPKLFENLYKAAGELSAR